MSCNATERAALGWFANYKSRDDRAPATAKWDSLNVQGGIIEASTRALRMVACCWSSSRTPQRRETCSGTSSRK